MAYVKKRSEGDLGKQTEPHEFHVLEDATKVGNRIRPDFYEMQQWEDDPELREIPHSEDYYEISVSVERLSLDSMIQSAVDSGWEITDEWDSSGLEPWRIPGAKDSGFVLLRKAV